MTAIAIDAAAPRGEWAAEIRASLVLGLPLVLTNVAQHAIHTTDVLLMGRLGPDTLAAGALGTNWYFLFFIMGIGITLATQPILAQERGANRFAVRELRRTVRQGFWAALTISVPIWAVLWQAEAALLAIGQEPELAREAGAYVRALQWGLLPAFWFSVLRCFVNALERPRPALVVTVLAIGLNALLAWALMFGRLGLPALGLLGAGIASTIANSFMFAALLGYVCYDRQLRRYRILGRFWRADWPRYRALMRLGIPISVTMGLESSVFNASAMLMGLIGREALAAHAIALQLAALTFMVPLGLAQAATVRVGLAAGAGDRRGVHVAGWTALALGTGFMTLTGLMFLAFPGPLVGLFLENTPANAPVLEVAVLFMMMAGLFQIADGVQVIGASVLRGLKDTRVPMLLAAVGYWVMGLPLGTALAFWAGLGGVGIWLGFVTGLSAVAVLFVHRWARREALGLVPGRALRPGKV